MSVNYIQVLLMRHMATDKELKQTKISYTEQPELTLIPQSNSDNEFSIRKSIKKSINISDTISPREFMKFHWGWTI